MTDKKKEYLLNVLKLHNKVVKKIEELCTDFETDKFAVWMGKESKKDSSILTYEKLINIIDWGCSAKPKPDILSFDYKKAKLVSDEFHKNLSKDSLGRLNRKKIDLKRIVFKCSDNKHFIYNLISSELRDEGWVMGHCVGSNFMYRKKLKRGDIAILSLRDNRNQPHVTFEINMLNGMAVQVSGKGNDPPVDKYKALLTEFVLWFSGEKFTEEEKQLLDNLFNLHSGEQN